MKILEINENDLEYNLNRIKEKINFPQTQIIAVVKANGMGLGLVPFAKFLISKGINMLAVATLDEAILLRKEKINAKILMLSEVYREDEIAQLIENDIILTIGSLEEKEKIESIAKAKQKNVQAHVKIDTGFGRYGFLYFNKDEILEAVKSTKTIEITGCYTHFSKPIDLKSTTLQFERFVSLKEQIKQENEEIIFHASSSTAMMLYPEFNLDAVRIGSCLQGRVLKNNLNLRKIGIFKSEIITIKCVPKGYNISYSNEYKAKRPMKIAVVPVRIYGWI